MSDLWSSRGWYGRGADLRAVQRNSYLVSRTAGDARATRRGPRALARRVARRTLTRALFRALRTR